MPRTASIYDPPTPGGGYRLLVMRLWPRGIRKSAVDAWEKDLGPSVELLRAFRAGNVGWEDYVQRYRAEMRERPELLGALAARSQSGTVTLLCGCKDESRCHRRLLKELVEEETLMRSPATRHA